MTTVWPRLWTKKLAWLICISVVFQAAPADAQNLCYGDLLDLTIRSTVDPADDGHQVALPNPEEWTVNIANSQNLQNDACAEEPVIANQAAHLAGHALLPDDARAVLDAEGVRLTLIVFSAMSAEGIGVYLRSYDWWLDNVYSQATVTDTGHLRRPSINDEAVGGSWLLAEHYPGETGLRVKLGCALDCKFEYRLKSSLGLRYHIVVRNKDEEPDWIAIDWAVRGTILDWFAELE